MTLNTNATPIWIENRSDWNRAKLIGFRWAFLFLCLLVIPELLFIFWKDGVLLESYSQMWQTAVPWIANNLFGVRQEFKAFGGGDTGYANLRLLLQAMLAVAGTLIWSLAQRGSREYDTLHYWLRVAVRYVLANGLLAYGVFKIYHVQFPAPPLTTLIQPFGQLTPHGLLWSFMGFSRPYQIFAGLVECTAAVLLFWNRTTTLGALLSLGALVNVLVMDWAYGVSVKLIVVRMLLLTGFLLLKDLNRLASVLLWNQPTAKDASFSPWRESRGKWGIYAAKILVAMWILGSQVKEAGRLAPNVAERGRPPLYGSYRVERQLIDGQEIATDDAGRWNLVAFDNIDRRESHLVVRNAAEVWMLYLVKYDEAKAQLSINQPGLGAKQEQLLFSHPEAGIVELKGALAQKPIELRLRKLPEPEFPLVKEAGPRWIFRW